MYLRQNTIDEIIVFRYTRQKETRMDFRSWCTEKWYEHCEEIEAWTGHSPRYLSAEYFSKYKWWLRREFRSKR